MITRLPNEQSRVAARIEEETGTAVYFEGTLHGKLAERLIAEAEKRNTTAASIAADILTLVIEDDLFAAVLDG